MREDVQRRRVAGQVPARTARDAAAAASPADAVLALQRQAGNRAVTGMLARAEGDAPEPGPPLLLTDRPWSEIEAEIAARNRAPFLGPDALSGMTFPIVIELPQPEPPPLLLDSVPYAERERLDRNQQRALGEYKRPEGDYGDDVASAPQDVQRLLFIPVKEQFQAAIGRLDRTDQEQPEYKRLMATAKGANDRLKTTAAPDYSAVIAAAQAVIDWVGPYLAEKAEKARTARVKDGGKFAKLVEARTRAAETAAEAAPKRSEKRTQLTALQRSLVTLENEVQAGASQADRERFAALSAQLDALLMGAPAAPVAPAPAPAGPDPDEDGRTGAELALTYRGQAYHLIPGNPGRTYGRIDPGLRLLDNVEAEYLAALQHGFVPANEVGESGVKDKRPAYFEIKLITKTAKRLGVGNTARIVTSDTNGLVQASSGIRYLTFDRWHDAH